MDSTSTSEIREVMGALHYRPAVSIIMPLESKINLKNELNRSLKEAVDKVERELLQSYPGEIANLVILKLRTIIKNLKFNTYKKSIAIYVSPLFEKVIHMNVTVEEKIIIDESFEIRDLLYNKKQLHKYIVLLLSAKECHIYLGNEGSLKKLASRIPESIYPYINDAPQRVGNFSDISQRNEIITDKFLRHIDDALAAILNVYHIPLFVLGVEKILGHFKKLSKHAESVTGYVEGNYEKATEPELKNILKPCVINWEKLKQKELLDKLEEAAGEKKLAVGIKEVWREAVNQKGQFLVVEKDYRYAALHGGEEQVIYKAIEPYTKYSYIKDMVDDVIEKVLENGGEVEFVDNDVLKDYHHIALIQYY
jgi:hypothetical protein